VSIIDFLLLAAVVAIVPLGMRLIPLRRPFSRRVLSFVLQAQPIAALAVIPAFLLPAGPLAAALALPWLGICALLALAALVDLITSRARPVKLSCLVTMASVAYLTVGAAWLTIFRAGLNPFHFGNTIDELTAVHFHYAGFAATLMAALALKALLVRGPAARRLGMAASLLLVVGSPLTAAGFTLASHGVQLLGAICVAGGVLLTAGLNFLQIAPTWHGAARWLLTASAFAPILPMLLAVDYTAGQAFGIPALSIQDMALIHGDLNGLGFVALGLVGWLLARRRRDSTWVDAVA
jgi:hypothetical protein